MVQRKTGSPTGRKAPADDEINLGWVDLFEKYNIPRPTGGPPKTAPAMLYEEWRLAAQRGEVSSISSRPGQETVFQAIKVDPERSEDMALQGAAASITPPNASSEPAIGLIVLLSLAVKRMTPAGQDDALLRAMAEDVSRILAAAVRDGLNAHHEIERARAELPEAVAAVEQTLGSFQEAVDYLAERLSITGETLAAGDIKRRLGEVSSEVQAIKRDVAAPQPTTSTETTEEVSP